MSEIDTSIQVQSATLHPTVSDLLRALEYAKEALDKVFITPSREKSITITKIDEAILWIGAIKVLPR